MLEQPNKCVECSAYNGEHSPMCRQNTPEQIKAHLEVYFNAKLREALKLQEQLRQKSVNRIKAERDIYKGKYETVKQENNALRKKINNPKPSQYDPFLCIPDALPPFPKRPLQIDFTSLNNPLAATDDD